MWRGAHVTEPLFTVWATTDGTGAGEMEAGGARRGAAADVGRRRGCSLVLGGAW